MGIQNVRRLVTIEKGDDGMGSVVLIRFLPETDYPRASRSFPRIAGSGNEIV